MRLEDPREKGGCQSREADRLVGRTIAILAKNQPNTVEMINDELAQITGFGHQRIAKSIVRLAKGFYLNGSYGKLRSALLLGIGYGGKELLSQLERAGLFLSDDRPLRKFGIFLTDFEKLISTAQEPDWHILGQRLQTYINYHHLKLATVEHERVVAQALSDSPRHVIKKVLVLVNLSFLRTYFSYKVSDELGAVLDELDEPENAAQIASLLVSVANKRKPLDSIDLGSPAIGDLTESKLRTLLRSGRLLLAQRRVAKEVSLFGYELRRHFTAGRPTFQVLPPFQDFEYGKSLGYVRMEISAGPAVASDMTHKSTLVALKEAAERIVAGHLEKLAEIRDSDLETRRVLLRLPISDVLNKSITEIVSFEDLMRDDRLAQDFLLPLPGDDPVALTPKITMQEFLIIWRLVQFWSLIDIETLRHFQRSQPTAARNSVVRVLKEGDLIEMIVSLGVSRECALEFLSLVAAKATSLGYYDLQYRPFLEVAPVDIPQLGFRGRAEFIVSPAIVASSNVFRNVQIANKVRLKELPNLFVEEIADILRLNFPNVTTNRRVKTPNGVSDIDVVLLHEDQLMLFECKHSVFPCGPHELRDVWEDIEKGTRQLHLAIEALTDPARCQAYLAGWFPGHRKTCQTTRRLLPCVLSSHRIFSGIHYNDVAVRDYASLFRLVTDGTVAAGILENGSVLTRRFRVTQGVGFSASDLADYLSPDSMYFKLYSSFMNPITHLLRAGDLTIAHETFFWSMLLEEWVQRLETLGFQRLSDEVGVVEAPLSLNSLPGHQSDPPPP